MASKRNRKVPNKASERPKKDRVSVARKQLIEEIHAKEADMEARTVGTLRRVVVVCQNCRARNEFEVTNRVPVETCPNCGQRVALRPAGPTVVNR